MASNIALHCGHGTIGCHSWVEDHPDAAETEGWHVRPWQSPADMPVLYYGSQWAYLTDEGVVLFCES